MPFYEFEHKDGRRRLIQCGMSELPALIERMKRGGWKRLYFGLRSIVRPGYHEALAESHRVVAEEDKQRARDRADAGRDLAEVVREELR